jgi:simple sugar transport system permease protein
VQAAIPFFAIVIAFVIISILLLLVGINPIDTFYYLLIEPLSTRSNFLEVLVKTAPLLFTGAAVLLAFSGGYFNIGAEGQLLAGAIAAAGLGVSLQGWSPWAAIPTIVVAGFIAGALWAAVPALLRVYWLVDEVVTTLLLNSVMALGLSGLLTGPWRDPAGWPRTPLIAESIRLPRLLPPSRLRAGIIIGVVIVVILWFVLQRTAFGLRLRMVGLNSQTARFVGFNVSRTMLITALVSGGIAGLAGVTEILGIQGRLIADSSPGYGYTGIVVAMLGGLTAPGVFFGALLIALIESGSLSLAQSLGVPQYLGDVAQAVILIVVMACFLLTNYRLRWTGRVSNHG